MKYQSVISLIVLILMTILRTASTTPINIYDMIVSDAKFLADMGEYYFGENDESDVRVVRHENSYRNGVQDRCMLPTKKGYCRALIPRFSYDPSKSTCVEFKYGGCDGNANNFLSFKQCMDMCGRAKRQRT